MPAAQEYIYAASTLLPFIVCLVWLAIYICRFSRATEPQRFLTLFAAVCTALYFCHSWFFTAETPGTYSWIDGLYYFCNLSVYPLFFLYIRMLTRDESPLTGLIVVFSIATGLAIAVVTARGASAIMLAIKLVFALEVVLVLVFGLRDLARFDRDIHNYYADTEEKTLRRVSALLICFTALSIISSIANVIGREAFHQSLLLAIPSVAFSAMLFALFYVGDGIRFYARDFHREVPAEAPAPEPSAQEDTALEARISALMDSDRLYLKPGLKISDVAEAVGSNRTYVSAAINRTSGMSFSDYVNRRRVEEAKRLLLLEQDPAISEVAEKAGFASFPSFYRAFVKFTKKSPSEWQRAHFRTK